MNDVLIYAQKGSFEKNSRLTIPLSSLVFIFFPPKKFTKILLQQHFYSMHWPPAFSTIAPLLPLPLHNLLDHVTG